MVRVGISTGLLVDTGLHSKWHQQHVAATGR